MTCPGLDSSNLRHHYPHNTGLQGVTVNKDLRYIVTLQVDILQLVRNNILSLGQLEYVLLTVDNLQCSTRQPLSYISCMQPTFIIKNMASSLRVPVCNECKGNIGPLVIFLVSQLLFPH